MVRSRRKQALIAAALSLGEGASLADVWAAAPVDVEETR